jgi:hypothetical protein
MHMYLAYYGQKQPHIILASRNKIYKASFKPHDRFKSLSFLLSEAEVRVRKFKTRSINKFTHHHPLVRHHDPVPHQGHLHKIHGRYPEKDGLTGQFTFILKGMVLKGQGCKISANTMLPVSVAEQHNYILSTSKEKLSDIVLVLSRNLSVVVRWWY